MTDVNAVAAHYGGQHLNEQILNALTEEGIDIESLDWKQLAAIDQFHTRGLPATREQAALAAPEAGTKVIDIGCGAGGPARCLVAARRLREHWSAVRALAGALGRCAAVQQL